MKKTILVDNSKAVDVPLIRPLIKNVRCKFLHTIEGEHSLSEKIYVVDFNGEEVYLLKDEIKLDK